MGDNGEVIVSDNMKPGRLPHEEKIVARRSGLLRFLFALFMLAALARMACAVYRWWTTAVATPVRREDYWKAPDRPVPLKLRGDGQIEHAIRDRNNRFDLAKDVATTEALRAYVEKYLKLQEETAASFVRLHATAEKLDGLLTKAPAKYRAMAALSRRQAEDEKDPDLNRDYLTTADIWEAKAREAVQHQHEVREHLGIHQRH